MAKLKPEFDKRNTKVIGLSVDPVGNHAKWAVDIAETQGHAEEALWRFPPERAHAQVLELLRHHDFVLANPKTAVRLLDRVGRDPQHGLEPVIAGLAPLRFRFWSPSLRRVGTRAHALIHES